MKQSVFERRPALTLSLFFFILLLIICALLEIGLRFIVPYDIGYYSAVKKPGQYDYPFGTIYMNAQGYPDDEFDLSSTKKRIGYFGDSVTFGTGVGTGYRFSDLLEQRYPKYDHWTFGLIGNGIQTSNDLINQANQYKLDTVIYALNLNDLIPAISTGAKTKTDSQKEKPPFLNRFQIWAHQNSDEWLRGRSYLYTWTRTLAKNALIRMGYGHTGFMAAELFPKQHQDIIDDVANRINIAGQRLAENGVTFCVLILPYEMQISADAAKTYEALGIDWEEGFTDGSTQRLLKQSLKIPHIYDGLEAFKGLKNTAIVGEYFVYNKGDKIDFNHPNRKGHRVLTDGMIKENFCIF